MKRQMLIFFNSSWKRFSDGFLRSPLPEIKNVIIGGRMSSSSTEQIKPGRGIYKNAKPMSNVDYVVDLRSDTVTKPSPEMRQKIATAEVGDDVMQEDFTVQELERRVAEVLGKESGVFVPSGTMGNLLALLVHCSARGSEVIVGDQTHIFKYEQGGMAQFGGIQANKLPNNEDGTFSIELLKKNIREDDDHAPKTTLICIENTHNLCGGRILPLQWIDEVTRIGREYGIPVHMDGARLFNAAIASGIKASRIVRDIASVNICLSKSLGTPIGSVLVGNQGFIRQCRRLRKALGGGMRQVGMMAAAGIYAMDHMIERLAIDHANAKTIAEAILAMNNPLFSVNMEQVETNMIMLILKNIDAAEVCKRLAETPEQEVAELGAAISLLSFSRNESSIRLVLHCDASGDLIAKAVQKIRYVASEFLANKNNQK